jgi:hypothetical protein
MKRQIVLFYAWQDDTDRRLNRHLIRIALESAAHKISSELDVGVDLKIDSDTEGVPGWAPITETILSKISRCDIFIPDLTFVATTSSGKLIPNPNVLFEAGYALRSHRYEGMMPIMNTAYGPPQNLPFDMAHLRHPITYHLAAGAKDAERCTVRNMLANELETKLRLQIAATQPPLPPPQPFQMAPSHDGPARFRPKGQPLGYKWDMWPFGTGAEDEIRFVEGPVAWLRVAPTIDTGKRWAPHELKTHATKGQIRWHCHVNFGW